MENIKKERVSESARLCRVWVSGGHFFAAAGSGVKFDSAQLCPK